jgi:ribosomal protein RSM22 (predicted rRNA methylase)
VQLPPEARRAIEERAGEVGFAALKTAASALSEAYREGRGAPQLEARARVAAYLVTRMPATYAATYSALEQLPPLEVASVLDVGSGTGAASLAARQFFPRATVTMVERDRGFAEAAQAFVPGAEIRIEDARTAALPRADLVIAAYSVGEFGAAVVKRLWDATGTALVVVEPGTPRGFATIRAIRDELVAAGARIAAPCPVESACPVSAGDWCHFAARVERSSLHRRVKGGELGWEDEKFSYIALARTEVARAAGRVVRHPQHRPGLIELQVCGADGLRTERVGKKEKERFRAARGAKWGERWG